MRLKIAVLLSVAMTGLASPVLAQSDSSVVVMRRSLDPKTRTYAWIPDAWSQCSNSCGAGQQTRAVQCMMNGKHGSPDVNCGPNRPADAQACYDVQGCDYTWQPGEWTDTSGCGQVVETRDLTCLRGDGKTVPNDQCPTPAPDTSREVRDLRTCSYGWKSDAWSAFSGECQTAATSTRTVWCERSNGEKVTDAECSASGPKPAASQTEDRYGQCGYSWKEKAWGGWSSTCQTAATRTREVVCLRSNGDEVSDAMCGAAGAKPAISETGDQYGTCSYAWKEQPWGDVVPACGTSSRSRTVQCVRSNGDVVADGSCDAGAKPAVSEAVTDYQTCTYSWNPAAWGSPSTTCGSATSTRSVTCLSSDGRTVSDSSCSGAKPDASKTTYETSGCGYSWDAGAYGAPVPACGPTVQNRSVTCLRSDGQTVADASCPAGTRPAAQQAATDYSTCTYGWTATAWGAWSNSCGNASQTRGVTCQSSDGRTVADGFCGAGSRPAASQDSYQTSGCGYSWEADPWSAPAAACGPTTQSRVTWCKRSDGVRVMDMYCQQAGLPQPTNTQGATDYSTCSFSWQAGGWSVPSTTCGSATQTRDVWCLRSDGTRLNPINDAACGGNRPAASQASYQTGSCSYARVSPSAWSGWDNACSGSANRTRTYSCQRSDGAIVDGSECAARGISLTETETGANYTNACPGYFSVSGWTDYNSHCSASATRTRTATCYRSGDNAFAGDQYCTDRGVAVPSRSETTAVYDGCGFTWSTGGWGAPAAACGASARYRAVWCTRSDGATVAEGNCNPGTRPPDGEGVTDYSACTYGWTYGGWNIVAQSCGSITQTRSVSCMRSDGAGPIPDDYCGPKPATSQSYADYSACSYARGDYTGSTDWNSHCSPTAYRYNYYNCKRADGAVVANAECTNRGISLTEQQGGSVLDQCGYSVSAWSGYSYASSCSASTTATQYATGCRRSDGADVAVAECSNRGIPTTQSVQTSNLSGCGYTWQAGGWSGQQAVCTTGTEYRDVWCQRTDGARVDGSLCGGGQPANAQGYSNANACGYSWYQSGFSGWNSACSSSATRTQTVYCRRSDGAQVADGYCGGGKPASSESTPIYSGCSYSAGYGGWSACPAGANATQSRSTSCTRVQTGEPVDQQTYCGIPATQTQGCTINPGGYAPGTTLGTYAFQTCSQQYDYGTQGTMPGINPAQCRTGVATYAQQCTGGGNFATNANCTGKPYVNNPRGPSGYPCDIVCR